MLNLKEREWKSIGNAVIEHVKSKKKGVLLFKSNQGVGKTVSTLKALDEISAHYIFLLPNHTILEKKLKDEKLKNIELVRKEMHIKGMDRMCLKEKELKQYNKMNINPKDMICLNCKYKENGCPYYKQFDNINEYSWAGVHKHLNMAKKIIKDASDDEDKNIYDALVIDEEFFNNVLEKSTFNANNLEDLLNLLKKTYDKIKYKKNGSIKKSFKSTSSNYQVLHNIIVTLIHILNTQKKTIKSLELVKEIHKLSSIELASKTSYAFKELRSKYYEVLYKEIKDNKKEYKGFKNIFDDVISVLKLYQKYYDAEDNIIVPITALFHEKKNNEIVIQSFDENLPNIPIICLDATGYNEVIEKLFRIPVKVYNSFIDIDYNVIQIKGAKIPLRTMEDNILREKYYKVVLASTNYWINKGVKIVFITLAHKRYSREECEVYKPKKEIDTRGKSIERFFKNHNFDMSKIRIEWINNMKGQDIPELKENGKQIIIGDPEPNPKIYCDQISPFFEGELPLSMERIKEPKDSEFFGRDYQYKDPRFAMMIKTVREHLLEHCIDRSRAIEGGDYKETIILGDLPIDKKYKAKRVTKKEFFEMKGIKNKKPETANIKVLKLVNKGLIGRNELVMLLRDWKIINELTNEKQGYQIVIDNLIKAKMIEVLEVKQKYNIKTYYKPTEKGVKYVTKK